MLLEKLEAIHTRFLDIEEKLSDPDVISDMKAFSKLNKEYKSLQELDKYYHDYLSVTENLISSKRLKACSR